MKIGTTSRLQMTPSFGTNQVVLPPPSSSEETAIGWDDWQGGDNIRNIATQMNEKESNDEMRWHDYMLERVGEEGSKLEVACPLLFLLRFPPFFHFSFFVFFFIANPRGIALPRNDPCRREML